MYLSNRIKNLEESGIRKIFDLATQNKGEYLNFSIGQPDFPAPLALKIAAQKAIAEDCNAYTPTMGLPMFREAIARKLREENQIKAGVEEVLVTSGVAGAIFLALSATINPGDEVILPDPYFLLYDQVLKYLGAKVVYLDTYPDFQIKAEKLADLVTEKTKMLILNTPNNPTGAVYSQAELAEVAQVASRHDFLIISDEIYEDFDYDQKFFSIGSIYAKTITLNGFSKSHSVTGWRVGYAHGPLEIIQAMAKLQQSTFVCAASFAQIALAEHMQLDLSREHSHYREKRDYVCSELKDYYEFKKTAGAFYLYLKVPSGEVDFAEKLIKEKVLTVPGKVFSQRADYFRISFAVDDKVLRKGVEILKRLA